MPLVLGGEHDRYDPLSNCRIGGVGGMANERTIVIVDLEKDRLVFCRERTKVMFFVRIVGMAEIIKHSDRLKEAVNGGLTESGDARGDNSHVLGDVLAKAIIEGTNAIGLGWHGSLHILNE